MNKGLSFRLITFAIIFTLSMIIIPQKLIHAEIKDGTYDVNYEMKEAGNDNTSIADGYFSKPATLTVDGGVQYIQLTITSSSMVKSLSAPSGPVDIVREDEGNETRTVKFREDGDLSEPVSMEMHVVVPDLYDMEHTARAVFDVSGLDTTSDAEEESAEDKGKENRKKEESTQKEDTTESNSANEEENTNTDDNESVENEQNETSDADETAAEKEEEKAIKEKKEKEQKKKQKEKEKKEELEKRKKEFEELKHAMAEKPSVKQEGYVQLDKDTSIGMWITFAVIGIIIIGLVLWLIRRRVNK